VTGPEHEAHQCVLGSRTYGRLLFARDELDYHMLGAPHAGDRLTKRDRESHQVKFDGKYVGILLPPTYQKPKDMQHHHGDFDRGDVLCKSVPVDESNVVQPTLRFVKREVLPPPRLVVRRAQGHYGGFHQHQCSRLRRRSSSARVVSQPGKWDSNLRTAGGEEISASVVLAIRLFP
jgi:hypothetical protein